MRESNWEDCYQTALSEAKTEMRKARANLSPLSMGELKEQWLKQFRHWYRNEIAEEMPADCPDNHYDVAERRAMVVFADDIVQMVYDSAYTRQQ